MLMSIHSTIGRPQIVVSDADTQFRLQLDIPQEIMRDLIFYCARDLLHNGSPDDATNVVQIAREIVDNF